MMYTYGAMGPGAMAGQGMPAPGTGLASGPGGASGVPQAAGLPPAAGPGSTGSFGGPSAPLGSVAHAWGPSPVVVPVDVKAASVGEGDKVVTLSGEDAAAQARVTAACAEVTAARTSSDLLMALRVRELRCASVFGTLMVCVSA